MKLREPITFRLSSKKKEIQLPEKVLSRLAHSHGLLVEELFAAYAYAVQLVSRNPKAKEPTFTLEPDQPDVFESAGTPVFPPLLTANGSLRMSKKELLFQIQAIIDMADREDYREGIFIYSLRVAEPSDFSVKFNRQLEKLIAPGYSIDVRYGYIDHKLLYSGDPAVLSVIPELIGAAESVELSLHRRSDAQAEKKVIHFSDAKALQEIA